MIKCVCNDLILYINRCVGINKDKNCIITSSHPSPLGAHKTDKPFIGSKCFSRCNEALISYGKEPIDWQT